MKIYINDTEVEIEGVYTVTSLLEYVKINSTGCAVAINNSIIPFKMWSESVVDEGDKITLIRATQGG